MSEKLWPDHKPESPLEPNAINNEERIERLEEQVEYLNSRLERCFRALSFVANLLPDD